MFFFPQNGLYWSDPQQWFTFTSESGGRPVPICGQFSTGSTAVFRVFRSLISNRKHCLHFHLTFVRNNFNAKTNITKWLLPCHCSNKVTVLMLIQYQCKSNTNVRPSALRCWFQTFQTSLALNNTGIQLSSGINSQLTLCVGSALVDWIYSLLSQNNINLMLQFIFLLI